MTKVIEKIINVCEECGTEVYRCEICEDYFMKDNEIVCDIDDSGNHAHKICLDDEKDEGG